MNVVLMGRLLASVEREHQAVRAQIAALNRTRRDEQLSAGEQMRTFEEYVLYCTSIHYTRACADSSLLLAVPFLVQWLRRSSNQSDFHCHPHWFCRCRCWVSLVSKNYELELVCARLENELKQRTPAAPADAHTESQAADTHISQTANKTIETVSNPHSE